MFYNHNQVILVGRLTKDPERIQIGADNVKCVATLAIDRDFRKEDGSRDTDFVPLVFWGKVAEYAANKLQKGMPVLINGRIQVRQYEKDDVTKWMTEVVVETFQALDSGSKAADAEEKKQKKAASRTDKS